MAKTKACADETVLAMLTEYLKEADQNNISRGSLTYEGFAAFLATKGIRLSANVLRHRSAVAEKFRQAKKGVPDTGQTVPAVIPLERRHALLLAFVKEYFVKGLCNYIENTHTEGNSKLPEYVKPEKAKEAVITPADQAFKKEVMEKMKGFFDTQEEKRRE